MSKRIVDIEAGLQRYESPLCYRGVT
jgi:hypothetical protein